MSLKIPDKSLRQYGARFSLCSTKKNYIEYCEKVKGSGIIILNFYKISTK